MVWTPGINYSSEDKLDCQVEESRKRAEKWDSRNDIIDAEFVEITEQDSLPAPEAPCA